MANLESENKVFRQQAVSMAPNKFLSGRSRSIIQVLLFYMYFFVEDSRVEESDVFCSIDRELRVVEVLRIQECTW